MGRKAEPFNAAAPSFPPCWHAAEAAPNPLLTSVQLRSSGAGGPHTRAKRTPLRVHAAAGRAAPRAACAGACLGRQLAAEELTHPETSAHTVCRCTHHLPTCRTVWRVTCRHPYYPHSGTCRPKKPGICSPALPGQDSCAGCGCRRSPSHELHRLRLG